jgi:hypothetical protein
VNGTGQNFQLVGRSKVVRLGVVWISIGKSASHQQSNGDGSSFTIT